MRIIVFSWHFLGVYSALWGLATGAFPSSVQIGELETPLVFTHGHSYLTHIKCTAATEEKERTGTVQNPKPNPKQIIVVTFI